LSPARPLTFSKFNVDQEAHKADERVLDPQPGEFDNNLALMQAAFQL
jgi:hypothetical protein